MWKAKTPKMPKTSKSTPPPIFIQEKIDPRVLIENLRKTAKLTNSNPR